MVGFITMIAMGAVRKILNDIIGKFTALQLQEAIDTDYSLWEHLTPELRSQTNILRTKFGAYFNQYFNTITTDLILEWQQKDHPALYGVLVTNPNGYQWLETQVNRFKKEIRGY